MREKGVKEVEKILQEESEVYELPEHSVEITHFSDHDFVGSSGVMLGSNMVSIKNSFPATSASIPGDIPLLYALNVPTLQNEDLPPAGKDSFKKLVDMYLTLHHDIAYIII